MKVVLKALRRSRMDVTHVGAESFPLAQSVQVVAVGRMLEEIQAWVSGSDSWLRTEIYC